MQIISYIFEGYISIFHLYMSKPPALAPYHLWFSCLKAQVFFFFCIRFLLLEKAPCISDHCCLEVEQAWVCLQHQSLRFLCLVLLFKTILKSVLSKIFFFVFHTKDQS